jgi:hypothetical protein
MSLGILPQKEYFTFQSEETYTATSPERECDLLFFWECVT